MNGSDSDLDMLEMDVDMVERSAAEKEAFRVASKEAKARELDMLEDAWTLLDSTPSAHTRLLNRNDFTPQVWAHLAKGRHFLRLARRIGCSAAAKAVRLRYKNSGRRYSHGGNEAFDAVFAFNERVLALSSD